MAGNVKLEPRYRGMLLSFSIEEALGLQASYWEISYLAITGLTLTLQETQRDMNTVPGCTPSLGPYCSGLG
jgi:hypothetical protein